MSDRIRRAHRGLSSLIVAVLFASLLFPLSVFADTNLILGGTARVAYANGDDVRLRESPGYGGAVLQMVREGAVVDVLDGPVEAGDGSLWYQVAFDGVTGYIVQDYLALESASMSSEAAANLPFNPAGDAIGIAWIAGTNGDGVRCRAQADPGAAVITVVPEGTTVEIIGAQVGSWQPINCAGQGGFVHAQFVSYDGATSDAGSDDGIGAFAAAAVTGEAVVSGTNGDGVRCRASASTSAAIITVLMEGSSVNLRGVTRGDFTGVVCAGQNGYVASIYLSDGSSGGAVEAADAGSVIGSSFVSGTNGDGVRCRASASFDASVVTVLPEGTEVSLRSGGGGDWQPVVCGGSNGWVYAEFLSSNDNSSSDTSGGGSTGSGVISGTNGDGVRCRTQASFNGTVITVLAEGTGIDIRGSRDGDWVPVTCGGRNGWVYAEFVGSGGGGASSGDDDTSGSSNSGFANGDALVVTGTGGSGVRLRSGAGFNAAIITVVAEGRSVTVISGSTGDWVSVSAAGTSGYIHMDYLAYGAAESDEQSGGGSSAGLGSGDRAMTLSSLNLRYDPSFGSGIAAVAPQGTVVEITGNPSGDFYPVNWDGLQGYMHGDYLSWTEEPLSERGGSANDGGSTDGGGGGGGGASATGNAMVDFAMQYLGYPYVWATRGPSSFDCSGFTYWIVKNVLGMDIGGGTFTQIAVGTPVGRGELQPGDLVFFQNTYTWGLSHVGMYIGNDQFIHAENESTGVVISSLNSTYYSTRWYGARRL